MYKCLEFWYRTRTHRKFRRRAKCYSHVQDGEDLLLHRLREHLRNTLHSSTKKSTLSTQNIFRVRIAQALVSQDQIGGFRMDLSTSPCNHTHAYHPYTFLWESTKTSLQKRGRLFKLHTIRIQSESLPSHFNLNFAGMVMGVIS